MCYESISDMADSIPEVTLPKARPVSKVVKDGVLALLNVDGDFFLGFVDTETTYTKEQMQYESNFNGGVGFTKSRNPIFDPAEITKDLAKAIAAVHGVSAPRQNQTVVLLND
jgi:hypothetical protein